MREVVTVVQRNREHRIPQSPRSSLRPPHKPQTKDTLKRGCGAVRDGASLLLEKEQQF